MDTGYNQAVQNLAWKIIEYSDRDLMDLDEAFASNPDDVIAYIQSRPEIRDDWDSLEEISLVICDTYDVEYEALTADVWIAMANYEGARPEYWN